jgi:pyruvate/2-oxoglutarate dehydrogenase complex dihydrolipoamide dehydrogenase (E3) component
MATRLMAREDPEVSELLESALRADGVKLLTNHRAIRAEMVAGQKRLVVKSGDQESIVVFDELLCAVGRRPRVTGYGLEDLDIALSPSESISSNACLQTRFPNIYAVGDVVGPFQFTHVAAHQAWYAVVNALFGRFKRFKVDYAVIPRTIFTDPEIARVGLSESEARAGNIPYELTTYRLDELDRAIADGSVLGFVRLLTVPGKDKILGVTIVGEHAGDLLAEYVLAMKHGLGLNKILGTIHSYPTFSEANKYAAGAWKKAHAPERILNLLARFHAWERR